VTLTAPDNSVIHPSYNEANLLERIEANLRGSTTANVFVRDIDYNAKGQRERIEYGNGVSTAYQYDPLTFRLTRLQTTKGSENLQDLFYTYDPTGNITHIRDAAQQTIYFRNKQVEPSNNYTYDAIYQLIEAAGREHLGRTGNQPNPPTAPDAFNEFHTNLDHPGDGNAMGNYRESYVYDSVGNILAMQHKGTDPAHPGWTRSYAYNEASLIEPGETSNRLSSTQIGNDPLEFYPYDAHGNMTTMPHLPLMRWNYSDELEATSRQVVNSGIPETTYYIYDGAGQRVRKVTERAAEVGVMPTRMKERIYLGGFEIYREYDANGSKLERESLHLMDGQQRVALVEIRTQGDDGSAAQLIRYQLGSHLGSASLELDETGDIISYEEYYPYGSTSYQAVDAAIKAAAKRYRYTGMERDAETGLAYHGARYYAGWLARWTAADPGGLVDGVNRYLYSRGNPITGRDPSGRATNDSESSVDLSHLNDDEARYALESNGFIVDQVAPESWPRSDEYRVFHGRSPDSDSDRWYRLYHSGKVASTSVWDENKVKLVGQPGGLFIISAVELARGGPSVMAEEVTIGIAVGGVINWGVGAYGWAKSVTNFDDIAEAGLMGAQEGAAEAVGTMNPFNTARVSRTGPLRPPTAARPILENEGLLMEGTPAANALQSRIEGPFRNVQLGQHGEGATKYLYTVDERGVNLVRELTPFPTPRGNVVHSNISSEASIGGEAWFGPNNSVTINAGSGRFGDAAGISQQQWEATVRLWESLGYKVNAVPFGKR
jgi:RHS repeat-associated protein